MFITTVYPNIKRYIENGFDGICKTDYPAGTSESELHKASIIEDSERNPVCGISEAMSRIKTLTGIERKPDQVRMFMNKHGFKYRKMAAVPGKTDTVKQQQRLEETLNSTIE